MAMVLATCSTRVGLDFCAQALALYKACCRDRSKTSVFECRQSAALAVHKSSIAMYSCKVIRLFVYLLNLFYILATSF